MLRKCDLKTLDQNVFTLIGAQWMLITAGTEECHNTMTASWGGLGVLWNKNVATCYIRPQRYTREFVDREGAFTLSFLGEEYRKELQFCGSKSGRDVNKEKECGFTPVYGEYGAPYFKEAELVLECRTLYRGEILPECFMDTALCESNYPEQDYHKMYMGEIVGCLKKER